MSRKKYTLFVSSHKNIDFFIRRIKLVSCKYLEDLNLNIAVFQQYAIEQDCLKQLLRELTSMKLNPYACQFILNEEN